MDGILRVELNEIYGNLKISFQQNSNMFHHAPVSSLRILTLKQTAKYFSPSLINTYNIFITSSGTFYSNNSPPFISSASPCGHCARFIQTSSPRV